MISRIAIFLLLFLPFSVFPQDRDSLKVKLATVHEGKAKVKLMLALSKSYKPVNIDSAYDFGRNALLLAEEVGTTAELPELYANLGDILVMKDQLQQARIQYEKAVSLVDEEKQPEYLVGILVVLGNIHLVRDEIPDAMEIYLKAIRIAERINSKKNLAFLYNNIGLIYFRTKEFKDGLDYFIKASKLFESTHDSSTLANVLVNIGLIYQYIDQPEISRSYFERSQTIFSAIHSIHGESMATYNLGEIDLGQGDLQKALVNFQKAFQLLEKNTITDPGPRADLLSNIFKGLGNTYLEMGTFSEAAASFKKGSEYALQVNSKSVLAKCYYGLAETYEKSGNKDNAIRYFKQYIAYSDSASNESELKRLIRAQMQYQFEQQLKAEKLESSIRELGQKRLKLTYLILMVLVVSAAGVMFLLFRLSRNKVRNMELVRKNLQSELEFRNKELTTYIMSLMQKNEFILDLSEKLKTLEKVQAEEIQDVLSGVLHQLEMGTSQETWKEFELRFQQVHTGFYKKLSHEYPILTQNELRLCAFLRLNLNTKEISAITYQTPNSITVARSRLRTKLGMQRDDSLIAYLTSL